MSDFQTIFAIPLTVPELGTANTAIKEPGSHPVDISFPLQITDFSNDEGGHATFAAFEATKALLCAGFFHDANPSARTPRTTWIRLATELIASLIQGIRSTHGAVPLPFIFSALDTDDQHFLNNLSANTTALGDFFTVCREKPEEWQLCLRCLEASDTSAVSRAQFESVTKSCGNDIKAACKLLTQDAVRRSRCKIDAWSDKLQASIRATIISSITRTPIPDQADAITDPGLASWVTRNAAAAQLLAERKSCSHLRLLCWMVWRRAMDACLRSSSWLVLTMVSAAEHSSFHHLTPRGSGVRRRLKSFALAALMSSWSCCAASVRDGCL